MADDLMNFELPQEENSIIKVIGVGGGGGNAVNHMYKKGITDVNFVVCNTDAQALRKSPIPVRIQLGATLTEGRGAGNKPEQGKQAAIESLDQINEVLENNTRMVFVTAGMGGGTGTGAAPVIAEAAKEKGILTVGIVTIPFGFEGRIRINQAIEGIAELKEHVDALLVIRNEKLREICGNLKLKEAFSKADDILTAAAKGIAEIITLEGYVNVDFEDVKTVMSNSGVALMGSGTAEGEDRAISAIKDALSSPLLNNNDISGASNILLNITSGEDEITMDEVSEITDYLQHEVGEKMSSNIIWGTGTDEALENQINVTVIATGFGSGSIPELYAKEQSSRKIIKKGLSDSEEKQEDENQEKPEANVRHEVLSMDEEFTPSAPTPDNTYAKPQKTKPQQEAVQADLFTKDKYDKLKALSNWNESNIDDLENTPAYKRRGATEEDDEAEKEEGEVSRYTISKDNNDNITLRENNSYVHDKVD